MGTLRSGFASRALFVALAAALTGCTGTSENRLISLPVPQASSPADLEPATQREQARILATYGGEYDNARLHAMIEKTVERLVAASERPDLKYQVIILNSPSINAFSLPNGKLYITRGLIALANDKAELASVLSHEMGHVIARHAAIREEQARQVAIINHVVNDVLSDPQVGALALAKSKLTLAAFSRAQEFEADGIGVGISARAGFDPYGASRFLTDMQRTADLKASAGGADPRALDFLSSHPATPDRVKNALANARQFSSPGPGERDRSEYLSNLDGMVYGEDPSEGFARGRHFLHPKLGFTFDAPAGFTLDNTAQAVLGLKEGGGEALRLDVVAVPAEQPLPDYLKSAGWRMLIRQVSRSFRLTAFRRQPLPAGGGNWSFRLYAVRFGSEVYRFIFAAKARTTQVDLAFRESIMSFRRMTLKESQQVRPLRLKIVTVGPNDTVEKFAHRMATSDHSLERFRTLNGLGQQDRLKPGEKVKVVVE
jgi:predicted Zn-dependent protease